MCIEPMHIDVPRITISVSDEQDEWLQEQAERRERSKSWVASECIESVRTDEARIDEMNTDAQRITERLDELEARIADLEGQEEEEPVGGKDQREILGQIEPAPTEQPEPTDQLEEALGAVDELTWRDETREDPDEYRAVLRSILEEIDTEDGLSKSDLQERVYPDNDVGFDRDNWWSNLVWMKLKELRDEHGVVHTQGGGKWTTWHVGDEQD